MIFKCENELKNDENDYFLFLIENEWKNRIKINGIN